MAVLDRPRTGVNKSGKGREVEGYLATFAQAVVDLGVGVEMCAARSSNQKGYGDDDLREATPTCVERGRLTVAAVRRAVPAPRRAGATRGAI